MKSLKLKLLSTTAVPVLVGAGIAVGGTIMPGDNPPNGLSGTAPKEIEPV